MPLNSVNTNVGAMVALQSLNPTGDDLAATQKRISTGLRVADAKDDGAAYAVAERIRGAVAATTSANEQLGGVKGLLDVSNAALENVSSTLTKLQAVAVQLAAGTITAEQRSRYQAGELSNNAKSFIKDATYNGLNVLDDPANLAVQVVTNGTGTSYTFSGFKAITDIFNSISTVGTWTRPDASNALTKTGAIGKAITATLSQLNNLGSYSNDIDSQITYHKSILDAQ